MKTRLKEHIVKKKLFLISALITTYIYPYTYTVKSNLKNIANIDITPAGIANTITKQMKPGETVEFKFPGFGCLGQKSLSVNGTLAALQSNLEAGVTCGNHYIEVFSEADGEFNAWDIIG